jgi:hypothetical protein
MKVFVLRIIGTHKLHRSIAVQVVSMVNQCAFKSLCPKAGTAAPQWALYHFPGESSKIVLITRIMNEF